ncbi:MAG: hypothetical protein AAGB51_09480 [Planctomycetota bacterium]
MTDPAERYRKAQSLRRKLLIAFVALLLLAVPTLGVPAWFFIEAAGPQLATPEVEFDAGQTVVHQVPDPPIRYILFAVVPSKDTPKPEATVSATDAAGQSVAEPFEFEFWKEAFGRSFKRSAVLTPTAPGPMSITVDADATEDFALFVHEVDLASREAGRWMPLWIAGGVMLVGSVLSLIGCVLSLILGPEQPAEEGVPGL